MQGSSNRLSAVRSQRAWLARACIALVLAWNVHAALVFLIAPAAYTTGFELTGAPGDAAVRGLRLLFLMWNVPYAVALWHPVRHRVSLYEALAMQTIGLLGESLILAALPPAHASARSIIARFIAFDAAGLLLLAGAAWLSKKAVA